MSMYTLLRNTPRPTMDDLEQSFQGNLCRCTGYRPILDGLGTFTKCRKGERCCMNGDWRDATNINNEQTIRCGEETSSGEYHTLDQSENKVTPAGEYQLYDPSQEPIFPSELQLTDMYDVMELEYRCDRLLWYRPVTMGRLLELKHQYPHAKLVIGNTEVGIEMKFKHKDYPVIISPINIKEMLEIRHTDTALCFGGAVTLNNMENEMKEAMRALPEYRCRVFGAVVEMLQWFAGKQIRNVASIAGNIMTASPISDLNPLWLAAKCHLTVTSKVGGARTVKMDNNFFSGYRITAIRKYEIITMITVPYTRENEYFQGFKQAHRKEDDISIVNSGMRVMLNPDDNTIQELTLAYGGMAPTTVLAVNTMKTLIGECWNDDAVVKACTLLADDLPLVGGSPGGAERYRRTLTTSFFFKFYRQVAIQLHDRKTSACTRSPGLRSQRPPRRGSQVYQAVDDGQMQADAVGRPLVHLSSIQQTTGETKYCDDIPQYEDELYLALVLSTKAHAKILSVDTTDALKIPGAVDYIDYKDVPGSNIIGHIINDEEIFATRSVHCQGQVIGAVLAQSQAVAQHSARLVRVHYEELQCIITIEEAIAARSYHGPPVVISHGDVESALLTCDHVVEGEVRTGAQDHFYLETHACIVVPKGESQEFDVISTTQSPTQAQSIIAKVLGIPQNRIICRVKRIGGGFGGKESRNIFVASPTAVAAYKHNRPVRCVLDRDEDMAMTGSRHPFLGRYKAGFTNQGKIVALSLKLYSNAGHSTDLSIPVMQKACHTVDNSYCIHNVHVEGYVCRTNLPSNTAFRGFGSPQSHFICETWMTHVAEYLHLPQHLVREMNLYRDGDFTITNQQLDNCQIRRCWEQVKGQSQFYKRTKEVEAYNSKTTWKKRGLAIIPVKFGSGFTETIFLNQAGALIHVYMDGSVMLNHGGVEMGQGLNTKMVQIASRVLKIPVELIHIHETSTQTVPNTSSTAASISSDSNGMAVLNACEKIAKRIQPYMENNPNGGWTDWVHAVYMDSSHSLSAVGFYDPKIHWKQSDVELNPYFTYGAAVSEVEIDCLTGDHMVLRTDIVMDVGQSLNPAVDIGQIEGAFMQGYGLFTIEDLQYSPDGTLLTRGPGTYKIPGFADIPAEFNVTLLKGSTNSRAVFSSKAIGEPPLFLSASVFFAIREAVRAARVERGCPDDFILHAPATSERIRMTCVDRFTEQFPEPVPGSYTPWNVLL